MQKKLIDTTTRKFDCSDVTSTSDVRVKLDKID